MHGLPPGWEISGKHLLYRGGCNASPPDISRVFQVPLSPAWFSALFTRSRRKGATLYKDDAYLVTTGSIVYSRAEVYLPGQWRAALKNDCFAVQVAWAEPTAKTPKRERANATMDVTLFQPNARRSHLEHIRTVSTTQQRFVAFLKSGALTDLESTISQQKKVQHG